MQERLLRELAASDFLIPNDELQVLSPLGANSMVEVLRASSSTQTLPSSAWDEM